MPPLKPNLTTPINKQNAVNRTDSIDSVQMEFNQIFENMFPKAAEKLLDHDQQKLSELNEEILTEITKVNLKLISHTITHTNASFVVSLYF